MLLAQHVHASLALLSKTVLVDTLFDSLICVLAFLATVQMRQLV